MTDVDEVRRQVYRLTAETGRPPRAADLARRFAVGRDEILEAFRRLEDSRLLALAPDSGEIVMAPPFSAVPTAFAVTSGGKLYYANCVWDAYGVAAALGRDADVDASCACCRQPMSLEVEAGAPVPGEGVAHFDVPAAGWWDDLVYT